ncbi:hypothetical protein D3C71_1290810 [compost metagenome]
MGQTEQRDGDAVKAVARRRSEYRLVMEHAQHLACAGKACEHAGDEHGLHNVAAHVHACIFGRMRIETDRAHFVALLRLPEIDVEEHSGKKRNDRTPVKTGIVKEGVQESHGHGRRNILRTVLSRNQQEVPHDIVREIQSNPVQHDRRDNFINAPLGLQVARNTGPQAAAQGCSDDCQRNKQE